MSGDDEIKSTIESFTQAVPMVPTKLYQYEPPALTAKI